MYKQKILLALSGGVDSSTTAKLLLNDGYEVIAATFFVNHPKNNLKTQQTIEKATQVAKKLGIQHHILDFSKEFENTVITDFINEYTSGRTPNPCSLCNATVKMPLLWKKAQELNCNKLATGHYVRIKKSEDGFQYCHRGLDNKKDQAYFLWRIPRDIIRHLLFPLGNMTKTEVRAIAKSMNLDSAESSESQEVCFIDNDNYLDFLQKKLPKNHSGFMHGDILDTNNKVVGSHSGYLSYTIGQRKGLGGGNSERIFVTKIDSKAKTIYVGNNSYLQHTNLTIDKINFHSENIPFNKPVFVQIRSGHTAVPGIIIEQPEEDKLNIKLLKPARAIAPGQSGVIFIDDRLIGGGRIIASS